MTEAVQISVASEKSDKGLAFKHLEDYEESKGWMDQSYSWVIPTTGWYHADVVDSWDMIDQPMNTTRTGRLRAKGMEVGEAYNYLVKLCIDEDFCNSKYQPGYTALIQSTKFIWTTEQDNIQPANAVTGLMASIYTCPDCGKTIGARNNRRDEELFEAWTCEDGHRGYDAVSGLYFTKTLPPRPMAYGDPANGMDDFTPRSVKEAVKNKQTIEVNGIGMGGAIWRKELFRQVSEPWFKTIQGDNVTGSGGATQDLVFCRKAKEEYGARFGVNCAVKIGHVDKSGRVF